MTWFCSSRYFWGGFFVKVELCANEKLHFRICLAPVYDWEIINKDKCNVKWSWTNVSDAKDYQREKSLAKFGDVTDVMFKPLREHSSWA